MRNGYIFIPIFAVLKKAVVDGKRKTIIELADRKMVSEIRETFPFRY